MDEVALQFVCEKDQLPRLMEIIKNHHPYEEVAMDIFPLLEMDEQN